MVQSQTVLRRDSSRARHCSPPLHRHSHLQRAHAAGRPRRAGVRDVSDERHRRRDRHRRRQLARRHGRVRRGTGGAAARAGGASTRQAGVGDGGDRRIRGRARQRVRGDGRGPEPSARRAAADARCAGSVSGRSGDRQPLHSRRRHQQLAAGQARDVALRVPARAPADRRARRDVRLLPDPAPRHRRRPHPGPRLQDLSGVDRPRPRPDDRRSALRIHRSRGRGEQDELARSDRLLPPGLRSLPLQPRASAAADLSARAPKA